MSATVFADIVKTHYPEAYQAMSAKVLASRAKSPAPPEEEWQWSFRGAVRIGEGCQQAAGLTGREKLRALGEDMVLWLEVKAGRRKAAAELSIAEVLALPDEALPMALLGVHPKPAGPSLWMWDPTDKTKPGWQERVLLQAVSVPEGRLLRVAADDGSEDFLLLTGAGGREVHKLSREQRRALDAAATDPSQGLPVEQVAAELAKGREYADLVGVRKANVEELLQALQGPGFMALQVGGAPGVGPRQPDEEAGPADGTGRRFAWGEGLTPKEVAAVARFEVNGPGSGRADMVLMGLVQAANNPLNRLDGARRMRGALAQGLDVEAATRQVTEALYQETGAPVPAEGQDPLDALVAWGEAQAGGNMPARRGPLW